MGDLNQRQIANAAAFRLRLGERKEFVSNDGCGWNTGAFKLD